MKTYGEKFAERQAKERKKLFKQLNLDENSTQEEINEKTLKFVEEGGELWWYHLDDKQINDPDFMLKLYEIREDNLSIINISDSLKNNVNFMVKYCRIIYDYQMEVYDPSFYKPGEGPSVVRIIDNSYFDEVIKKPEFYVELVKEFPDCNIFKLMYCLRFRLHSTKYDVVKSIIEQLPKELFISQAKKFGSEFLCYFPKSRPDFVEFVEYGIECDGFKSLNYLNKKDIVPNKHLIIKAFDKDGAEALKEYFNKGISPHRESWDEDGPWTHFDTDYILIQKALMCDKKFWDTLRTKMSKKEQKNFSIELYADRGVVEFLDKLSKIGETKTENQPDKPQENTKQ